MGMYTEIFLSVELKENTPVEVIDVLKFMFSDGDEPNPLPDHRLFSLPRWMMIGKCSSYYFVPSATSRMWFDDIAECWFITSRSDLKNYDGEIEAFFDWLMPFVDANEGQFIGYHRYEEDDAPKLVFAKGVQ